MLSISKATLHYNTKISEIVKTPQEGSAKPLYTLKGDGRLPDRKYDIVIVAAPLAVPKYFFNCKECNHWPKPKELEEFWQTVATFVQGQVNMSHFGFLTQEDIPEVIGTTENPRNYFNSIGKQESVDNRLKHDPGKLSVRKVFSRLQLTSTQLDQLFSKKEEVKVVSWLAYPHYTPPEKFWSFVLDDGVFYVNAIEQSASAMEMSAVSAKNAALLAFQYYTSTGHTSGAKAAGVARDPKGEL